MFHFLFVIICSMIFQGEAQEMKATTLGAEDVAGQKAQTPLDESVLTQDPSNLTNVLPGTSLIQRRIFDYGSRFLGQVYASTDFSDSPVAYHALGIGLGYRFAHHLEFNLVASPFFYNQVRSVSGDLEGLTLASGANAQLISPNANFAGEADLVWNFAYGKDSWGLAGIIRSESLIKLGYRIVSFEGGQSGYKATLLYGKTFLLSRALNLRVAAGPASETYYVNGDRLTTIAADFEVGEVIFF